MKLEMRAFESGSKQFCAKSLTQHPRKNCRRGGPLGLRRRRLFYETVENELAEQEVGKA